MTRTRSQPVEGLCPNEWDNKATNNKHTDTHTKSVEHSSPFRSGAADVVRKCPSGGGSSTHPCHTLLCTYAAPWRVHNLFLYWRSSNQTLHVSGGVLVNTNRSSVLQNFTRCTQCNVSPNAGDGCSRNHWQGRRTAMGQVQRTCIDMLTDPHIYKPQSTIALDLSFQSCGFVTNRHAPWRDFWLTFIHDKCTPSIHT